MDLIDLRVRDIVIIETLSGYSGKGIVESIEHETITLRWLWCSNCYTHDTDSTYTIHLKNNNNDVLKLELIQRMPLNKELWVLSENIIDVLHNAYTDNLQNLMMLSKHIDEYGITDDGISDITNSFEYGYKNALEFVFTLLNATKGIKDDDNEDKIPT